MSMARPGSGFRESLREGLLPVAVAAEFDDVGVMNQPVDDGDAHHVARKDAISGAERLVGGDGYAAGLVAMGDEPEQHGGLGFAALEIADIVNDQPPILVQFRQGIGQVQGLLRRLEFLHQGGGREAAHAQALLDQSMADGGRQVALADTGGTEQQEVAGLIDSGAVTGKGAELAPVGSRAVETRRPRVGRGCRVYIGEGRPRSERNGLSANNTFHHAPPATDITGRPVPAPWSASAPCSSDCQAPGFLYRPGRASP